MDADKILANLKQVVPFYQPIFSADTHQVIGYEILGHIKTESNYTSLESFIHDETIPEEYRIEVDNYILNEALNEIKSTMEKTLKFLLIVIQIYLCMTTVRSLWKR